VLFFEGELLGLAGFGLLALFWVMVPVWAISRQGMPRTRLVTGAGVLLLAYLVAFTILGYVK